MADELRVGGGVLVDPQADVDVGILPLYFGHRAHELELLLHLEHGKGMMRGKRRHGQRDDEQGSGDTCHDLIVP